MACVKVEGEVVRFHERVRTYEVNFSTFPAAPVVSVYVVGNRKFSTIETRGWHEALAVARCLVRLLRGMERNDMEMVWVFLSQLKPKGVYSGPC